MRRVLAERLGAPAAALRQVFANRDLRRLELAWASSLAGGWSFGVAIAVFAYEAGGPAAAGVVTVLRSVLAAFASPWTALLADRFARERVMVAADGLRALALVAAVILVALDASAPFVYALAAVVSVAGTALRAAKAALVPNLAREPAELTAMNVVSGTTESVAVFLGPAVGGLLLALAGIEVTFAVTAGAFLLSALLVARIHGPGRPERSGDGRTHFLGEALGGFRLIAREPGVRAIALLTAAQSLVYGALTVLIVVISFRLVDLGGAGVGLLYSALGIGGLLGSLVTFALIARGRLATDFALANALWGVPIALIAVWPNAAVALVLLAVVGAANTVADVAGTTLLQRAADNELLARVFGALETLIIGSIGVGALLAPALVAGLGTRGALLVTGALLPVLVALLWRRLAAMETAAEPPSRSVALLRGCPIFAPLPEATLEQLAGSLVPSVVAADTEVVRLGEPGDRFYLVEEGELEARDGTRVTPLGPGDWFGEIALLRDVPRTATVRAVTASALLALERDDFLRAVTENPRSLEAADTVIGTRLGSLTGGARSV